MTQLHHLHEQTVPRGERGESPVKKGSFMSRGATSAQISTREYIEMTPSLRVAHYLTPYSGNYFTDLENGVDCHTLTRMMTGLITPTV